MPWSNITPRSATTPLFTALSSQGLGQPPGPLGYAGVIDWAMVRDNAEVTGYTAVYGSENDLQQRPDLRQREDPGGDAKICGDASPSITPLFSTAPLLLITRRSRATLRFPTLGFNLLAAETAVTLISRPRRVYARQDLWQR